MGGDKNGIRKQGKEEKESGKSEENSFHRHRLTTRSSLELDTLFENGEVKTWICVDVPNFCCHAAIMYIQ